MSARVIVCTVGTANDHMMVVRHYDGSGSYTNLTEVYVVRDQHFLGRFENDEFKVSSEYKKPLSKEDLNAYRTAYLTLTAVAEKLWK